MVHALKEIRRVLAPGGILIDLRPLAGSWPIEVASGRETREVGQVSDLPVGLEDDQAANRAMAQAEEQEWIAREREEFFPFLYYWDSPNEMKEYIDEDWEDFISVDETTWKTVRAIWAVADADARLRIRVKMLITRSMM
jgi:SAM-dependent methyltransferase